MKDAQRKTSAEGVARVFIVDDEETVLNVLSRTLRRAGYDVATFTSARAFLDGAKLDPPCCLVLDVNMPEITGVELQAQLARLPQPPSIVFISGAADVTTSVRAMKAGAIDFLAKPFEPRDLVAAVQVALQTSERRLAERQETSKAQALLAKLTPRERQVCELVAQGLRSKEIAERLGSAVKTVNIHRSRIMSKLGATTVVELVRLVGRTDPRAG
jgi:FixJ family two-component response regulator